MNGRDTWSQRAYMFYTTITVSTSLSKIQKDFLVKTGFAILGISFSKSVQSSQLHIIISQLAGQNIPFKLQTQAPNYNSKPCAGCKR